MLARIALLEQVLELGLYAVSGVGHVDVLGSPALAELVLSELRADRASREATALPRHAGPRPAGR